MKLSKGVKLLLLGIFLIVLDQVVKVLVKTNMSLGEVIPVFGNWFRICFVENEGMAFGMKFGGALGKFLLSAFRIVLSGFLIWWMSKLLKKDGVPAGVPVALSVITAGAIGNLIDSLFYGIIWDYAPFMYGRVVDMFSATFFPPVFNVADACVTCGAFYLIIFQWKFFASNDKD